MQEGKKDPEVIGVAQPCPGSSGILYASEVLAAEGRKLRKDLPHFSDIFNVLFV